MTLPQLVHNKLTAFIFFLVGGVATIILYQYTNRIHLMAPAILPMTWVDRSMPFTPWTIWIYFTEYLIFIVSWLWLQDPLERTKYFYSYMMLLVLSVAVFIIWPTTFPRTDYPLDAFPESLTKFAFQYFRDNMDTPANCVPSLHVSSCYIASFVYWKVSKQKFLFFFLWATAVAISTMTTKQHYFMDVWTAILLTGACYFSIYRLASVGNSAQVENSQSRDGMGNSAGASR